MAPLTTTAPHPRTVHFNAAEDGTKLALVPTLHRKLVAVSRAPGERCRNGLELCLNQARLHIREQRAPLCQRQANRILGISRAFDRAEQDPKIIASVVLIPRLYNHTHVHPHCPDPNQYYGS